MHSTSTCWKLKQLELKIGENPEAWQEIKIMLEVRTMSAINRYLYKKIQMCLRSLLSIYNVCPIVKSL